MYLSNVYQANDRKKKVRNKSYKYKTQILRKNDKVLMLQTLHIYKSGQKCEIRNEEKKVDYLIEKYTMVLQR